MIIALSVFILSSMSAFFLVGKFENHNISHSDIKASVIQHPVINFMEDEEQYRKIINNNIDEFLVVDKKRNIKFLTDGLLEKHNFNEKDIVNMNVLTLVHPKDLAELSNILVKYHAKHEAVKDFGPLRTIINDKGYNSYLISIYPLYNEKDEFAGSIIVLKDTSVPLGEKE